MHAEQHPGVRELHGSPVGVWRPRRRLALPGRSECHHRGHRHGRRQLLDDHDLASPPSFGFRWPPPRVTRLCKAPRRDRSREVGPGSLPPAQGQGKNVEPSSSPPSASCQSVIETVDPSVVMLPIVVESSLGTSAPATPVKSVAGNFTISSVVSFARKYAPPDRPNVQAPPAGRKTAASGLS